MKDKNFDVIIMGGGIMGLSTAYHLMKADSSLKVIVIEKDLGYEKSSTALSMVNVRIQFSLKENVQISQYASKILENFEDEMAVNGKKPAIFYRREGNLFLYDEKSEPAAQKAFHMQKELGCAVEWWSTKKLKEKYPMYENLDNIVGATFGPEDGHLDAYALLMGFKTKAASMGVSIIQDEVVELIKNKDGEESGTAIQGVKTASGETFYSSHVVNCTGAWAARLLKTAGIDLPIDPTKRQVFAVKPEFTLDGPLPLTILPSGFYFRTETGGLLLLGKSMENDPVGFDFSWDQERFELLWEELYEFAPVFEALKLIKGWSGLYAVNTMDANAILGEWPNLKGLYLANGFSGHGMQQGPAVGRYITELITGQKPILDLSIFNPIRILENNPIREDGIV
ncbi:MAG: FAD-binding oxidoreductase [Desulfobacula sp.]|jgi:FAD-dependent oxidoreductase domain-containing protein 1|uniref:NAD(P)/FAD-dependent oxidoreductase n=2 Tax=Desulfobacula sp. TaxID=2593537 RepID=UPI001D86BAEB|nr:FAD-binding oxidoreductase [Desulfobacula sp.]MBT3483871.1 FAD-binding oxidoreductase [Desulfobacula sp.]MBT3803059.1 FAD-binding oxidoreductase [Desulfobacula sp.]MBT4023428.1 FAD-binding oxidoreductase [Desulfobacula sp.]MBT4197107.1 FAD-binding oxidoreductase [Desulfobacula sp.]